VNWKLAKVTIPEENMLNCGWWGVRAAQKSRTGDPAVLGHFFECLWDASAG